MIGRLAAYVGLALGASGLLWILAVTRPSIALLAAWLVADAIALVVTWRVARREGRHPLLWLLATALTGPLAWILLVATTRSGATPTGDPRVG